MKAEKGKGRRLPMCEENKRMEGGQSERKTKAEKRERKEVTNV